MGMQLVRPLVGAVFGLLLAAPMATADSFKLSAASYVDSRSYATASVALSYNNLPGDFSVWGFTDFHGDQDSGDLRLTRYFSEYRLSNSAPSRWLGIDGLSIQGEFNSISNGDDVTRFGLAYKHELDVPWAHAGDRKAWLQWRLFPYETDNDGGQASLIFFLPLTKNTHLQGFADYNVRDSAANRWLVEPEWNYRINSRVSALIEYRYNGFEDSNSNLRGSGVSLGLRVSLQ